MKHMFLITFSVRSEVGWLVAGISPRKPGFNTRPVCVVFVVDNVHWKKFLFHNFRWTFRQCSTLILFITDSIFVYPTAQQPPLCQGLLVVEDSRWHSETPHSVGLFWTNDQPVAKTCIWQHTTLTRHRHPCLQRYSNPQPQQTAEFQRLWRPSHWRHRYI